METIASKKLMSFRLNETLLNALKREAKKANRSLSNYVECVLSDSVYSEPNKATLDSVIEARSGKFAGTVKTGSVEDLITSIEE
jgi:hypothetical protein